MKTDIRIVIADDHPVYRRGLSMTIAADPALKIVAEAEDGMAALECIRREEPDVAVLDVDMPGQGGFDVVRALRQLHLATEVVFLTMHKDEGLFNTALDLGVKGYVLKDSAITDIVNGIEAVQQGQSFISPALVSYLVKNRAASSVTGLDSLTPAERKVLRMIAQYKTTKEIADALYISPRTVETHRANICQKLNLRGSHSLMRFALAHLSEIEAD